MTSGAQWTRDCASRWRTCVEEVTRWSNDPPLGAEHAIVQRDSRFPKAIHLWASRGWSRITARKFPHTRKQIGRSASCPSVRCFVRVPSSSWPRPSRCRSTVGSCDLGKDSSGRRATPSLLRAPLWTLQITDHILLRPVTGLPPAQDATSQAASVEFPPHMLWMNARRWQMGLPSWAVAENENATSLLAHRRRETSHSGG